MEKLQNQIKTQKISYQKILYTAKKQFIKKFKNNICNTLQFYIYKKYYKEIQKMDKIEKNLLKEIANIESIPSGAYNIRKDGNSISRNTTANIDIVPKKDKPGIDIIIKENTKNESVHIPVILTKSGLKDMVYNDFYIGKNANVVIIAGCRNT